MSQKGYTAEEALAASVKKLMGQMPFEKITIRDITDEAGMMRPTFYNHFKDKYDLLEWIFLDEIVHPAAALIESNMMKEAVHLMLKRMESDMEFYRRASRIKGQNSFRDIAFEVFKNMYGTILGPKMEYGWVENKLLTPETLAEYYAAVSVFVLMKWLDQGEQVSAEDVMDVYSILVATPLVEMIEGDTGHWHDN